MNNKINIVLFILLALVVGTASAHRGRRDRNGGHVDSSTGVYHCHTESCVLPIIISEDEDVDDPPDGEDDDPVTIAGSWGTVKTWARDKIYTDHNTTFYCGCTYTPSGGSGGVIDHSTCDYDGSGITHEGRADRLEWEHIVPASLMPARQFACWNEGLPECSSGGRSCCERHDLNARVQIFDLHNLVPSVGQANALRSNKRYGLIDGEVHELGMCDFEWNNDLTEPADGVRGDAARIWLYFVDEHGLQLQEGELQMYMDWSNDDPPDEFEFIRNDRIIEQQGNGNPFVEAFPRP